MPTKSSEIDDDLSTMICFVNTIHNDLFGKYPHNTLCCLEDIAMNRIITVPHHYQREFFRSNITPAVTTQLTIFLCYQKTVILSLGLLFNVHYLSEC
jgi:hypothetical protein